MTIRNLDDETKRKLKLRAASMCRSMEEEARIILKLAVAESEPEDHLVTRIRARFQGEASVDLVIPTRQPIDERLAFDADS